MAVVNSSVNNSPVQIGSKFGRWSVVSDAGRVGKYRSWKCECECGAIKVIRESSLTSENTKSCGCYSTDRMREIKTTHGKRHSPEYVAWAGMKARCGNANERNYASYGGRGIVVCERWRNSFQRFYEDMGPRPSDKHSIDRINNDGNYEPSNCRWATGSEQCLNQRRNRVIVFNGKSMPLSAWATEVGLSRAAIAARLKMGWSVERALTHKLRRKRNDT